MSNEAVKGISQRSVGTVFSKTVVAYIGDGTGYRFDGDVEVIVTARNKNELDRFFSALGLEIDTKKTLPVAIVNRAQADLQIANYQVTPQQIVPTSPTCHDEDGEW